MTEQALLQLKKDIDAAKTKLSELQGKKASYLEILQTQWGCKNLEQAKTKLKGIQTDIDKLSGQLATAIKELEDKYEFS